MQPHDLDISDRIVKEDGHWLWVGAMMPNGYGQINYGEGSKHWVAHRLVWFLSGRELPQHLHHLCGVRSCVNPEHLVGTTWHEHNYYHLKDRCSAGHPFDEDNTYWRRDGRGRQCRTCKRDRMRQYSRENRVRNE